LVLFFLRFGLCVRKEKEEEKKKRNEHCANVSIEKKTFFFYVAVP
jgi:hypothetical protein